MSVTFTVDAVATGEFTATCHTQAVEVARGTLDDVRAAMAAHKADCDECHYYGIYSEAVLDVDIEGPNFANSNARTILDRLGLGTSERDLCGSATGEQFLGAVLLAEAALGVTADDSGVAPARVTGGVFGGATMVDCGVRTGYYAEAFAALRTLAQAAADLGRDVVWS